MFDQAKAEQVIERVWQGQSLRSAASEVGVKHSTFLSWLPDNPPLSDQYARAIEERASVHAERIERVVDQVEREELAPDQARVMVDALKWTASKLNPRRYGDRVQQDIDLTVRVSIADPTRQLRNAATTQPVLAGEARTVPALEHGGQVSALAVGALTQPKPKEDPLP
jgi:DNA-binding transcriptional regulator YdaS (Cro superfamily)